MTIQLRSRLGLEALERRETPAVTATLRGGTLHIVGDNQANDVLIAQQEDGTFEVSNTVDPDVEREVVDIHGAGDVRNIRIRMGRNDDNVSLLLTTGLPGNLTVNLGGGRDYFTTGETEAADEEERPGIGGNAVINTGATPFDPVLGEFGEEADELVELINVNFGHNVRVVGSRGVSTPSLALANSRIRGDLRVTNFQQVSIGNYEIDQDTGDVLGVRPAAIDGSVFVNNRQKNTDARVSSPTAGGNAVGNALFMYSGSSIGRNLVYLGGTGRDDVDLPGDLNDPEAAVTIGGNVIMHGGKGIGTLALGQGRTEFGALIGGNVLFTGKGDIDRFFLDSGSEVAGNVTLRLDGGNNQVFGDPLGLGTSTLPSFAAGPAVIGGNLRVNLGNGDDFIGSYLGDGTTLTVGGNVRIDAGRGNQRGLGVGLDADGNPVPVLGEIAFFNENLTVGGRELRYTAGNSSQSLAITYPGAAGQLLRLRFRAGPNSVFFGPVTGEEFEYLGRVHIDFGRGPGFLDRTGATFAEGIVVHGRFNEAEPEPDGE